MGKFDKKKPQIIKGVDITIIDNDGMCIPNVDLSINDINATTDENGNYKNTVPSDWTRITLVARKAGLVTFTSTYTLAPSGYSIAVIRMQSAIVPITYPTPEQCRKFRGNFCGIRIQGLRTFSDHYPSDLLYTPAYGCYNSDERKLIRQRYLDEFGEWSHFPITLQPGPIYGDYFPNINPSIQDQKDWLEELYRDKIIPVVNLLADNEWNCTLDPSVLAMIRVAFPKWEQNQIDPDPSTQWAYVIHCRQIIPTDTLLYLHFSPDHAAIDSPESDSWKRARSIGIQGILLQTVADDPIEKVIDRHKDFVDRMKHGLNGWPNPIDIVSFELKAYPRFHRQESYESCVDFAKSVRLAFPELDGYCNG